MRARNNKQEGKLGRVAFSKATSHSALFKASFAKGAVEVSLLADRSADADLLKMILTKKPDTKLTSLSINQIYRDTRGRSAYYVPKR